jgi:hypothetical protein
VLSEGGNAQAAIRARNEFALQDCPTVGDQCQRKTQNLMINVCGKLMPMIMPISS